MSRFMKLYKCPLTSNILTIFAMSMENNVLVHHAANYRIDDNYLYFPEERFKDKSVIKKLIDDGIIFISQDDETTNKI